MNITTTFLAPGACSICELSNDEMVDTLFELDCPGYFWLNGRKYVCVDCAGLLAEAIGYVPAETIATLAAMNEQLGFENAVLKEKHLEDVDSVIAAVTERMAATPARKASA